MYTSARPPTTDRFFDNQIDEITRFGVFFFYQRQKEKNKKDLNEFIEFSGTYTITSTRVTFPYKLPYGI